MANYQGHRNSGSEGPNMKWGHEAAQDGSWEYSWGAGSVSGGPSFCYGSASARSDGRSCSGSGFAFSWGTAATSSVPGQGPNQNGSGQTHHGSGQFHMGMPYYGMSFRSFPMGPMFEPPRPPPHSTYGNHGPDRRKGEHASSR